MKKIKYKNLKISNFLSVGNDAIEIDFQKGLNQIDGINSDIPDRENGVGKSVQTLHVASEVLNKFGGVTMS